VSHAQLDLPEQHQTVGSSLLADAPEHTQNIYGLFNEAVSSSDCQ